MKKLRKSLLVGSLKGILVSRNLRLLLFVQTHDLNDAQHDKNMRNHETGKIVYKFNLLKDNSGE